MQKTLTFLFAILLAAAAAGAALLYFSDGQPPALTLTPGSGPVGKGTEFTLAVADPSGLRTVIVSLRSASGSTVLASQDFDKLPSASLTFTLGEAKAPEGPIEIVVSAVDGSIRNLGKGNAGETVFPLTMDTRAPHISVLSGQHNLTRGGVGCISYTLNEDVSRSGVRVGNRFFPGYRLPAGNYACLFAFPYDMTLAEFSPRLEAEDLAGNRREQSFPFHANDRTFRADVLEIPDSFLDSKMSQYEADYPEASTPLEIYLKVNTEMRARDDAAILELGQTSASEPLWRGDFLRLPNSAPRAGFADARTYRYKGEVIDNQTHLGVDLASLQAAQVPAANAGVVVRTGFHGIYGENVIIDHGLGLMTIYSHLSQIDVDPGATVTRGQIIGRTGATGLAGGDHLHYGVYVSGVAVNPIEWWDSSWIKNNVADRVGHVE